MKLFYNSSCVEVKEYIKEGYNIFSKQQLIDCITMHTRLKENTILKLYKEVEEEKYIEEKNKEREDKSMRYKGRERNFFKFDTSNLWRNING